MSKWTFCRIYFSSILQFPTANPIQRTFLSWNFTIAFVSLADFKNSWWVTIFVNLPAVTSSMRKARYRRILYPTYCKWQGSQLNKQTDHVPQSLQIKDFQSQTTNWKTYKATKLPNIQLKLYASPSNLAQWTKQPTLICKTHADQTEAPTNNLFEI